VTTVLSRAPGVRQEGRRGPRETSSAPEDVVLFDVPGDTGRAYARVSSDWNPHHLWPITARPLGYRRPIAHGMWALARLIGLLPAEVDTSVGRAAVTFHRPILMPGTVAARVVCTGDGWTLDAFSPERGTPHVRGTFRSLR
jgi:acyl dehydratase